MAKTKPADQERCARHVGAEQSWSDVTLAYMAAKKLRRKGRKVTVYGCSQCEPLAFYIMDLSQVTAPGG